MVSNAKAVATITYRKGKASSPTKFEMGNIPAYEPTDELLRAARSSEPLDQQVDFAKPIDVGGTPTTDPVSSPEADQLALINKRQKANDKASVTLDILNDASKALNEYFTFSQISNRAETNIILANNQAHQAMSLGKDAALREETKGFARGEQSLLSAAAQGQSVSGGVARSGQLAEETYGIYNALTVENNAIREAYGYKLQAISEKYNVEQARIQRDLNVGNAILSGVSKFGVNKATGVI